MSPPWSGVFVRLLMYERRIERGWSASMRVGPVEEFGTGDAGALLAQMFGNALRFPASDQHRRMIDKEATLATLGIDLAVRAAHVATLTNDRGEVMWSRHRFHNRRDELAALIARVGDLAGLMVVMEPTRNAWVPVAAYFRAVGATVVLIAPEQSADLRRYYKKHTKNDRLDSLMLSRVPLLHPEGLKELSDLGPADANESRGRAR
jgi:hypothetical protein